MLGDCDNLPTCPRWGSLVPLLRWALSWKVTKLFFPHRLNPLGEQIYRENGHLSQRKVAKCAAAP